MTTLKITIDNQADAKVLASFLRTLGYVKKISIEQTHAPLADEDWVLPGRQATEAELDKLLDNMNKDDDSGFTTDQMIAQLEKWKTKSA